MNGIKGFAGMDPRGKWDFHPEETYKSLISISGRTAEGVSVH
jgi:hypothetical protein